MRAELIALTTAVAQLTHDRDRHGVVRLARRDVAYIELPDFVISVQSAAIGWAPNGVFVNPMLDLARWSLGAHVQLRNRTLAAPGLVLSWPYRCAVVDLSVTRGCCAERVDALLACLFPVVIPQADEMDCPVCTIGGVIKLSAPDIGPHLHALSDRSQGRPVRPATVDALVGLGRGLTPEADDLLCGVIATQWALGVAPIDALAPGGHLSKAASSGRTTSLSATWLRLAIAGQTISPLLALLHEVPGSEVWRHGLLELLRVGSTTGPSILSGAILALVGAVDDRTVRCPVRLERERGWRE